MGRTLLSVLIKAFEQDPKAALSIVQTLLDLVKANPALLSEILGSIKGS